MLSGPWHQALGHCLGRTDSCWGVGNGGFSLSGIHTLYLFPSTVLQSKLGVCWPPSTVSFVFPVYFSLFRARHVKFLFSDSYLFLRLSCLFSVCVCIWLHCLESRPEAPPPLLYRVLFDSKHINIERAAPPNCTKVSAALLWVPSNTLTNFHIDGMSGSRDRREIRCFIGSWLVTPEWIYAEYCSRHYSNVTH